MRVQLLALLALAAAACGADSPAPVAPPANTSAPPPAASVPAAPTAEPVAQAAPPEQAHRLMVMASACWLGGVWSDAEGDPKPEAKAADDARCHDVLKAAYNADDADRFKRLRSMDDAEIDALASRVVEIAKADAVDSKRVDALGKSMRALGAVLKETMNARRAADKIKHDLKQGDAEKDAPKLSVDEYNASGPLKKSDALAALYALDAGDLTPEVRAIGTISALDRMGIARGLPKHLKVYVVGGAFNVVFGAKPPEVADDPSAKLVPGTWLKYLADTAAAAGHPVPDKFKKPIEREPLAWGGVLQGFADKLKVDASKMNPEGDVAKISGSVVNRLEAEYRRLQTSPAAPTKK